MIDHTELTITDDDHVDGVKEAISLLLANKPYLVDGRRRGGSELRGQLRQGNSNEITRSKIRAWMHNEDGGMTPERMKLIEEAQRAGKIDVAR
jgi:hypothetical protein